ncbi:MAG: DUF465 domain-containing protein [Vicinamibacterales bacterium]
MAEAQDLKNLLLETNDEFRQLASQHHDLDERLVALESKHYLSDAEQLEEVTLKKKKLHLKDRMEAILRDHRAGHSAHAVSV